MSAPGLPKIVDEILEGVPPLVRVDRQRLASHTRRDLVNLLVLKCFPQVVRNVEHDALKEKGLARGAGLDLLENKSDSLIFTCRKRTKGTH